VRTAATLLIAILSLSSCQSVTGVAGAVPNGVLPLGSFQLPDKIAVTAFNLPTLSLPQQTSVGVRLTNTGSSPAIVEHGACSVSVWLYRRDTTADGPAWQNVLPPQTACIAILYRRTIAPQESYDVTGAMLGARTIGDSLPAGSYLARVAIRRRAAPSGEGEVVVLDAGTVALP